MNRVFTSLAALALGLAAAPAVAAIDTVYTFGDSFVDSGNANLGTGGAAASAAQGYFQGRFGDGYNFADLISKRLTGSYADPFLANPLANTNYAVGGARAAGIRFIAPFPQPIPGLPQQVNNFYVPQQGGPFVDPNGLYILSFGNNDVGAIQAGDTYGLSVSDYEDLYVTNLVSTISFLNAGGADTIMLFGVPNPNEIEGLSLAGKLAVAIAALEPTLTSNFIQFDFFDFFARVQATPQAYGLTADVDFTTPCIDSETYFGGPIDCTGFFSFDGIHVTKPVQYEIAREALAQAGLATIPEPAVWLQMIVGFGLAGTIVRARRVVSAT